MNILLTNDDGIHAEGINALFDVLCQDHRVYMIAPMEERSACSSAITVRSHIKLLIHQENKFAIDGFPADCVNIGLNGNLIPDIDLVISGINHGPNLGDDIYFSGTVAGARSAYIFGVSGIAVSLDCLRTSDYFREASLFINDYISEFPFPKSRNPVCLNVNYPDLPADQIKGIRYTSMGKREYRDRYRIIHENKTEMSLQLDGTIESRDQDGSDITELRQGYISITPISLDCTDYTLLREITPTKP